MISLVHLVIKPFQLLTWSCFCKLHFKARRYQLLSYVYVHVVLPQMFVRSPI